MVTNETVAAGWSAVKPALAASYTQAWMSVGAILMTIASAMLADALSRRTAYFLFTVGSLLICAYLFRTPIEFGARFLVLAFLAGGLTASFYGWLPLYLPELFPTRVRATAQGFAFNAGRVFSAGGVFAGGALLKHYENNYQQMCSKISLVYLIGMALIWFCPETKGKPLPE